MVVVEAEDALVIRAGIQNEDGITLLARPLFAMLKQVPASPLSFGFL